jgi:hypothetical protein
MSKIGEAKKKNSSLRDTLMAKNSVQLKNFFKGLTEAQLKAVTRAVKGANDSKKGSLAKKKQKQIAKLQKELSQL